ncbi:DUF1217 domain-containing protein [Paracoccus sp. (in: a-proteobacteria)]|uniref:DUF1217 domain-containing protein n=1 Tax=Paracoccus sp. TaxID=267 RepID=UPI0026E0998C|nr:DUF1217 domain-containing protein [Paracoccus sp. (in: a-proteobacteria)]MDO5647419.1 DUF1217 domain-containing protein [Paracoccus sp. (in: a-proteobacteria)]
MSITIGATGLAGWTIIQRTEAKQLDLIAQSRSVQQATAYFREKITQIQNPESLVKDYRLLNVALSSHGLEDDLQNRALIQKVLESDLSDDKSLANRMADKRYLRLAQAFAFNSPEGPAADLVDQISAAFVQREFERRVGESDENMRLALNLRREMDHLAGRDSSDRTLWYEVMGNKPLRKVFEGAFGFGPHYGKLPVERQLTEFMKASQRVLGSSSFAEITKPEAVEKIVKNFLARSQIAESQASNRYSAALTLLQGG